MSDYPTIALTGPGAIGTTIAAVLHEAGRTPLLCGRTAHPELRLRHDEGEIVVPGPVLTDPSVITRPVDLVFLAVKTTQNADSAGWLRALCDENTVVCALQNGVEQKAQLAPLVNGATVLPSVVWFLPSASRMPPSGCAPNRALRCRTCRRRSGWWRRFAARAVTLSSRQISLPSPGASCCKTRSPG